MTLTATLELIEKRKAIMARKARCLAYAAANKPSRFAPRRALYTLG